MIKIAIVEDEEESFLRLKEFAERYEREKGEKVETRWFTDGMAFIDGYEAGEYTVVFMDIDMPHINGIETARELRKRDEFVPLIFVSIMVQYAIEGYSVDAMDFLVKPIQYLKFSMKLDKAVTYSRKNRSTVIKLTGEDGMTQYIVAGGDHVRGERQSLRVFPHEPRSLQKTDVVIQGRADAGGRGVPAFGRVLPGQSRLRDVAGQGQPDDRRAEDTHFAQPQKGVHAQVHGVSQVRVLRVKGG